MSIDRLSRKERDAIESLKWAMTNFGSLLTNRQVTRSTIQKLISRGLAQSVGLVQQCDDDGGVIEHRLWREGFTLTDAGEAAHTELMRHYRNKDAA